MLTKRNPLFTNHDIGENCYKFMEWLRNTDDAWRADARDQIDSLSLVQRSHLARSYALEWKAATEKDRLKSQQEEANLLWGYDFATAGMDAAGTLMSCIPLGDDASWLPRPLRARAAAAEIAVSAKAASSTAKSSTLRV